MSYIGTFPKVHADWLLSLDEPEGITDFGNGRVRFTATAFTYLRNLPEHLDGRIDDNDTIWIAYESYKLTRGQPEASLGEHDEGVEEVLAVRERAA
jgi:hypothetical protein